jgi:hypothetical protein
MKAHRHVALLALSAASAVVACSREPADRFTPEAIPELIEEQLPCKTWCRVTEIVVDGEAVVVTVLSDDVPDRTLSYQLAPDHDAELAIAIDRDGRAPATIEHGEVDYALVAKSLHAVNQEALPNKHTRRASIEPCFGARGAKRPVRACIHVSVDGPEGFVHRKFDARTGALVE